MPMSKVTIATGGHPFSPSGIGSGTTSVSGSVSQTFTLPAMNQINIWLAGNGTSSQSVTSCRLSQGAKSIPVTVNGATSFIIPATGRWSDAASISDFTLPGEVTLTAFYQVTVNMATFSGYENPNAPVITSTVKTESGELPGGTTTGEILFDVEFEGSFTDSVNGWTPSTIERVSLETDPANIFFGSGSGKFEGTHQYWSRLRYPVTETFVDTCMEEGYTIVDFRKFSEEYEGIPAGTRFHWAEVYMPVDPDYFIRKIYINGHLRIEELYTRSDQRMMMLANGLYTHILNEWGFMSLSWMDAWQVIKGAVWTENFTPPTTPFTVTPSSNDPIEITYNTPITVTSNPVPGGTLVLHGGTEGDFTFTFVNHYPNNQYEIEIGTNVNETAANIAAAINKIPGAIFVATVVDNVVSVNAYTPSFSTEKTGDGLTLGAVTRTLDGLITEEVSAADSFTATDGGKAVQENVSVADTIVGLIDGLSENASVSDSFDVPMDSLDENVSVSTNIDGLIDMMGESND